MSAFLHSYIVETGHTRRFQEYAESDTLSPLFLLGDALLVLKQLPGESVDFFMTSPPYWGKREYANGGIGLEEDYRTFIDDLASIFLEAKRVLKSTGSFWLNIGDSYQSKRLLGIPWRLAIKLCDEQGWILRNSVIWNKVKGGFDNSDDRLGNAHENVFHFVKQPKGYYYDADSIRDDPKKGKIVNGAVISATGVTGIRYKRQIELSTRLSDKEKTDAFTALERVLASVGNNEIGDFRMIIRGQQRTTHSDSSRVSGRAKELETKGFYFLKYHPGGSKPTDVWDILPEDTQKRGSHFAPFPEDLCRLPISATCPVNGIVMDMFCGTGSTLRTANKLGRKAVGIDISREYLETAAERCVNLL